MKSNFDIKELAILADAETLYDTAPCGYLSFTSEGTIFKINQTLLAWLQLTPDEVLYKVKFSDLISKGGNIHFEMFFRPMINVYGNVKELRYELIKKNGSAFTVLISANAIKKDDGKIAAINAAVYDITDRKQYEHELLLAKQNADTERKRFTILADQTPQIIWTTNSKGHIDYVNQQFFNYWGLTKKQVTSSVVLSRVHPEDRAKLIRAWVNSLKTTDELKCEVRLLGTESQYHWHMVRARPNFDEDNNLSNWFGTCTNIDEHINALKQKDEFISIASHELKTPITSLNATLQFIDRIKNTPRQALLPQLIDQANRSMQKITRLVDDLLTVGRMHNGYMQLNKTQFTIQEFWAVCFPSIMVDNRFELIIQGDLKLRVNADVNRLEQVVINFINNAAKYAPESKEIYFIAERNGKNVKISVRDQGPGIAPNKIPHLFERYYRVDHSSTQYSGLGLGLYICADIIKRHGGKIGADSELGKGSTFWFTLPAILTP